MQEEEGGPDQPLTETCAREIRAGKRGSKRDFGLFLFAVLCAKKTGANDYGSGRRAQPWGCRMQRGFFFFDQTH